MEKKELRTDLLIVGAGPGGLAAALYASRAGIKFEVAEKYMAGGQIVNTESIENYPGFEGNISGFDLAQKLVGHCRKFGVKINEYFDIDSIKEIDAETTKIGGNRKNLECPNKAKSAKPFRFSCHGDGKVILAKTLIIATGASPKKLNVDGENELIGRGISFCATCDGALYKDKIVAVAGGGNAAIEEAIFLTKFAKKVYVIHRRDELRAIKILQNRAFENKRIEFLLSSVIEKFSGEDKLEEIIIKNKKNNQKHSVKIDGVFEYVGISSNSGLVKNLVKLDENNFIITNFNMEASSRGIFAVGDVRNTPLRQVVTAVADGAIAAMSVNKYLNDLA